MALPLLLVSMQASASIVEMRTWDLAAVDRQFANQAASGNFLPPSPLLPHPPVYDENRTATVVVTGADVQNSNNAGANDFGVGGEITFSAGIDKATVYPDDDVTDFKVVNATALLSNLSFSYFVYYKHPLAMYTAGNLPGVNSSITALYQSSQHNVNFTTGTVLIKQVNPQPAGAPGEVYVSFNVYDPRNDSRVPDIPSSLLEFGVLSILRVPCSGAGISC